MSVLRSTLVVAGLWSLPAAAAEPASDAGGAAAPTEAADLAAADDAAPDDAAPEPPETIVVVGSNTGTERSVLDTPVPVDVIDPAEFADRHGQFDLNRVLQFAAPSFNANRQSGSDGADHVDPATLRGLGPDQTLVLVNGKRRHQSSLINLFGSRGRGNTGTDLNAIPVSAIERVEILRDGASALYGSDAIAGVINIVLKSSVDQTTVRLRGGVRDASPPDEYDVLRPDSFDGEQYQVSANHGFALGEGGFVNLTADYLHKGHTNRAADPAVFDIYRQQFGDAALDNISVWLNSEIPLADSGALYAFGGYNLRFSDAFAWTRTADSERNVPAIYPNGFDPHITSQIDDASLSLGWRHTLAGWRVDLNNTFGLNRFHYTIEGTVNASLGADSPTEFDAGGHGLMQNTTGLALSRTVDTDAIGPIHLGAGAEVRVENFTIFAGEEGSWRNYAAEEMDPPPGGSQGFPGYRPENEVDETRQNVAAYVDSEFEFTEWFLAGLAGRYEYYTDFGSTFTAKLAARLDIGELADLYVDNLALRASASTGFRAPSLAQIHYNTTFTDFVGGVAIDKVIARNGSELTRSLGIPDLEEETSRSVSAGLTFKDGAFSASADGYLIDISDRIVLTGAFDTDDPEIGDEIAALGVGAAQFFTNALDTRSYGLDVVASYAPTFGVHGVRVAVAGNFNWMDLGDVKTSSRLAGKEDIYFGEREQHFLLASAPPSKLAASLGYTFDWISADVRVVRFGEVVLIDWLDTEDVYEAAVTIDASLGFAFGEHVALVVGVENLLDTYPTQQDTETETGGLWDAVQMGTSGSLYFGQLTLTL